MKCNSCSFQSEQNFAFCPNCSAPAGEPVSVGEPVPNPVGEKVMSALKDKLFLAICVLMTVSAFLGLASGGIPVFPVLFSIFLWMTFSKVRKNIVDTNQLKNLSGTVYAQYIVFNVTSIILIVCGVVSAFLMGVLGGAGLFDSLLSQFDGYGINLSGALAMASGWIILVVCLITAGIILAINLLGWRKIHRFAKSIYQSINTYSNNIQCAAAAKNWILAFGIIDAVSALTSGDFITILATGSYAAAAIVAYLLINKYLTSEQ